ncbi:MAG: phage tail protein [Sphingomonas sp.]
MATLILTAVGTAIGGPIGGAIGALAGQAIDQRVLFAPKGRQGPRLTELAIQTSSYGTQIPKLFGTLRVAGSVIWATDLIESRARSSGGKGQPSTSTYNYAASFAVLLSARAIMGVRRIWADGKLLRGAAGDFKTQTMFRLHLGGEDQPADPLIASAEGAALTPAHRGSAYAVFENFQLGDYGNRIPSLTFEVEADVADVSVGTIAATLSDGLVDGRDVAQPLVGFSAYGDSVRGVLETLATASGGWFAPAGDGLVMRTEVAIPFALADTGYAAPRGRRASRSRTVAAIETVPQTVTISHYDPSRDYQAGLQRARRPGAGNRTERVDLAAAIDGGTAKAIAERVLVRAEAARERRQVTLSQAALAVPPGAVIVLPGDGGRWRANGWSLENNVVGLDLVRLSVGVMGGADPSGGTASPSPERVPASSGRVLPSPDIVQGPTLLRAVELPSLDDSVYAAPRLTVVAAGELSGWRRAALLLSTDGGASYASAGVTAAPGVIGTVSAGARAAPAVLRDLAGQFEVMLAHDAMLLADASDAALDAGANLALVGNELVQFGRATRLGERHWRLDRLLRGRRASVVADIVPGQRFVLLDRDASALLEIPLSALDGTALVLASGVGDVPEPAQVSATISGVSVRPPSPVHFRITDRAGGYGTLRWARRSRAGWRWIDGADVPLAEEAEAYRLTFIGGDRAASIDVATTSLVLAEADLAQWTTVELRQHGRNGDSPSRTLAL